jgi:hypothetical protein
MLLQPAAQLRMLALAANTLIMSRISCPRQLQTFAAFLPHIVLQLLTYILRRFQQPRRQTRPRQEDAGRMRLLARSL